MYLSRIVATLLVLFAGSTALAQSSYPQPVDIAVPHLTQDTDDWCWLAVTQMVVEQRRSYCEMQCEMIEDWDSHPDGSCCTDYMQCHRTGINLREIQALLEDQYGIHSRYGMPILENALYTLLMSDMPVIAQIRQQNITHAVVIRGMLYVDGSAMLVVNDPGRDTPHEVPYRDFAVYWMDALVITH